MWWRALLIAALALATGSASADQNADFMILMGKTSSASSSPVVGCTNQFVLNYSNSCALIGQAFGE